MRRQLATGSSGDHTDAATLSRYVAIFMVISICTILMQIPVMGHQDNADNSSAGIHPDKSGIEEASHLIELDIQDKGYSVVSESIVYSTSALNGSEEIILWVPETAEIKEFKITDMAGGASTSSVSYRRENDLLYFPAGHKGNSSGRPVLYGIRYVIQDHENDQIFRKVFREEGIFEYPISRLIIIIRHEKEDIPEITSPEGFSIVADEVISEGERTSYAWYTPHFNELSISLGDQSIGAGNNNTTGTIALLILLILAIAGLLFYKKKDHDDPEELKDMYEAEKEVLARIEEDRKNNILSREEFEELQKKHSENASRIKIKMERSKRT